MSLSSNDIEEEGYLPRRAGRWLLYVPLTAGVWSVVAQLISPGDWSVLAMSSICGVSLGALYAHLS